MGPRVPRSHRARPGAPCQHVGGRLHGARRQRGRGSHHVAHHARRAQIGKAIDSYPEDLKIAMVGTGGLSHQMIGERAGFNDEKWDREFLDLIERDPERLASMSVEDFMERGGNEGAEVIMWLIMRGALRSEKPLTAIPRI